MFRVIAFVVLGSLLGVFLSFPAFAFTAITCAIAYACYNFDGTIIRCLADLLVVVVALQLGYFFTAVTMIFHRRLRFHRRSDQ
jgi:uncharacterized membrane protein YozB (DUF420 family)